MKSRWLGTAVVLASLLAFAGVGRASATIDLLWDGTTDTLCGAPASSVITLDVVLTAGPNGSIGGGISVDYSDSIGKAELIGFSSSPPDSVFPVRLGTTFDSESFIPPDPRFWWAPGDSVATIHNIGGSCLPAAGWGSCLGAGQSYLLGTLTFRKTVGASEFEIVPLVFRNTDGFATDAVLDLTGRVITDTTTFNSAYVIKSGVEKGLALNERVGEPRRCGESTGIESGTRSHR